MSEQTPTIDRKWIREFGPERLHETGHFTLVREIVIQERTGNYFDIYQTWPQRRLLTRLTLDECLGYAALAIAAGRPERWNTLDHEREWNAKYHPTVRRLEPWEKQLPQYVEPRKEEGHEQR